MSKKHFRALAAALLAAKSSMPPADYYKLVEAVADVCAGQSKTFSRIMFRDACFPNSEEK